KAIRERSAILHLKNLTAPVLILHTETDENVPVNQAYLLRDRLTELHKDFEIKIFPQGKHGWLGGDLISATIDFFNRRLTLPFVHKTTKVSQSRTVEKLSGLRAVVVHQAC